MTRETLVLGAGMVGTSIAYPFPRDSATLLRLLPNRQIDIRYRPRGLLAAAGPLLQYWCHSSPALEPHLSDAMQAASGGPVAFPPDALRAVSVFTLRWVLMPDAQRRSTCQSHVLKSLPPTAAS